MSKIKALLAAIVLQVKRILAYLPTDLPVGKTAMHAFYDDILELAGKYADTQSMKWVLSTKIMQLDQNVSRKSKMFFVKILRKAAANQVASDIVLDIKTAQQEAIALANKLQAEATANQAGLANAPQTPAAPTNTGSTPV